MHIDLSNNTKYPDVEEYFGFAPWTLFYLHLQFWIIGPLSLVGNSVVIYTSLKYRSLKMGVISSTLLEHLAVADMVFVIIGGWPIYITLCANRWILGKFWCALNFYLTSICGCTEILILATISLYRAALLKNPFLFRGCSKRKMNIVLCLVWFTACTPSIVSLFSESVVYYEPRMMSCTSTVYTTNSLYILVIFLVVLMLGLPMISILASNILMLIVSTRYKRRMAKQSSTLSDDNMKAVTTVTCICWAFLLSWIPYIIRIICEASDVFLPVWFFIFQVHFLSLNMVLNPIIYTLTNKSFKEVLQKKVLWKIWTVFSSSEATTSI